MLTIVLGVFGAAFLYLAWVAAALTVYHVRRPYMATGTVMLRLCWRPWRKWFWEKLTRPAETV